MQRVGARPRLLRPERTKKPRWDLSHGIERKVTKVQDASYFSAALALSPCRLASFNACDDLRNFLFKVAQRREVDERFPF
jgi:hypothetical protein